MNGLSVTLIRFYRNSVRDNAEPTEEAAKCLQLAMRLVGQLIKEQPSGTSDFLASFDFRAFRKAILQARDAN